MGGSLVGNDIDGQLAGLVAAKQLGEDLGCIAHVADGPAAAPSDQGSTSASESRDSDSEQGAGAAKAGDAEGPVAAETTRERPERAEPPAPPRPREQRRIVPPDDDLDVPDFLK
jgi:hypothetical protein